MVKNRMETTEHNFTGVRWMIVTLAVTIVGAIILDLECREANAKQAGLSYDQYSVATFAGGCFWCMEPPFDGIPGVLSTIPGYTGGRLDNPDYEQVASGKTDHAEAIRVFFDSKEVGYEELLVVFWRNIDPTSSDRQFCDVGPQYRSSIFYNNDAQKEAAFRSFEQLQKTKPFEAPIRTEIVAATQFFPAEEYHQDFYLKNPIRYQYYRLNCGRDRRLRQLWGDTVNKSTYSAPASQH